MYSLFGFEVIRDSNYSFFISIRVFGDESDWFFWKVALYYLQKESNLKSCAKHKVFKHYFHVKPLWKVNLKTLALTLTLKLLHTITINFSEIVIYHEVFRSCFKWKCYFCCFICLVSLQLIFVCQPCEFFKVGF